MSIRVMTVGYKNMLYRKRIRALPRLKELMKERDIRQKDMSVDLGLTTRTINGIVNGTAGSMTTSILIVLYLHVKWTDIFETV